MKSSNKRDIRVKELVEENHHLRLENCRLRSEVRSLEAKLAQAFNELIVLEAAPQWEINNPEADF